MMVFDDNEFQPVDVTDRPNPMEDEDIHTVSELYHLVKTSPMVSL